MANRSTRYSYHQCYHFNHWHSHLRLIVVVVIVTSMTSSAHYESHPICGDDVGNKTSANGSIHSKGNDVHNNNNNKVTGQHCRVVNGHRVHIHALVWEHLGQDLMQCGMSSLASISDQPYFISFNMKFIGTSGFPFVQYERLHERSDANYDDQHQFEHFIRRSYMKDGQKSFVIAVENPASYLRRAESVFLDESYRELALMPHRTKWLVILWTERQWEEMVAQQLHSVFDNVAIVKTIRRTVPALHYDIESISSFMWRVNRTRKPSNVHLYSLPSDGCSIFPNQLLGLNGRELVVAPKPFLELFLRIQNSSVTGEKELSGVLLDFLNSTSIHSNYTFVMRSPHNTFAFMGLNWSVYADYLNNGSMDIGLSAWSTLFLLSFNLSFSEPLIYDTIVGIYRLPLRKRFFDSWVIICPFPFRGYLFLLACALYASSLYVLTVSYCYSRRSGWSAHIVKGRNHHNWSSQYKLPMAVDRRQGGGGDKNGKVKIPERLLVKMYNRLLHHITALASFLVAALNQSYLPRPHQMSARLVVGVWALGVVFFYAAFSSFITAQMVIPRDDVPFTTLKDMLRRSEYKGLVLPHTVILESLQNAKKGTLLYQLNRRTRLISLTNGNLDDVVDRNLGQYLENMEHHTVFFHYESAIKAWLRGRPDVDDYYVMDSDPIFNSDVAIVFPKNSELRHLISDNIRRLYETGVQTKMFSKYNMLLKNVPRKKPGPSGNYHPSIQIHYLFWLGIICVGCLVLALFVLILEIQGVALNIIQT